MLMQQQSNEELCNLLVQSLIAGDDKLLLKILDQEDEAVIKDIINRVPANHVRKLAIELRNALSIKSTVNHLIWLQNLLALKYTVISSMADGRSILIPLISLLEDRSSIDFYTKMLGLKGKLTLLRQLKESRRTGNAETVVKVQDEPGNNVPMEIIDSETDTDTDAEVDGDDDVKSITEEEI